jgi:hypothetical protein
MAAVPLRDRIGDDGHLLVLGAGGERLCAHTEILKPGGHAVALTNRLQYSALLRYAPPRREAP